MNIRFTTKELNESGKLFYIVDRSYAHLLTKACYTPGAGCIKVGHNEGWYGWNYDLYVVVKSGSIFHIVTGYRNFPKALVKMDENMLKSALAVE